MNAIQIVTFSIGDYMFGIPSEHVLEVFEPTMITKVSKAPNYLAGVINVRGVIITVVDYASVLNIRSRKFGNQDSCHLIFKSESESISLLADSIGDIIEISPHEKMPCPFELDKVWARSISHTLTMQNRVIYVLHTAKTILDEIGTAA